MLAREKVHDSNDTTPLTYTLEDYVSAIYEKVSCIRGTFLKLAYGLMTPYALHTKLSQRC